MRRPWPGGRAPASSCGRWQALRCPRTTHTPDLILHGGRIYTVDAARSGRRGAGHSRPAHRRRGRHRRDPSPRGARHARGRRSAGAPSCPGFIDGHPHMDMVGLGLIRPSFDTVRSIDEILAHRDGRGRAAAAGRVDRVQPHRRRARSLQDARAPEGRSLAHAPRPRPRGPRQSRLHRAGDPGRARPRLRQHGRPPPGRDHARHQAARRRDDRARRARRAHRARRRTTTSPSSSPTPTTASGRTARSSPWCRGSRRSRSSRRCGRA